MEKTKNTTRDHSIGSSMRGKTVLVTGSAGFIGFHVARRLLDDGVRVIGVDDFNAYYDPKLKEQRNAILESYPGYTLHRGDLSQQDFVNHVFKTNHIDKVCHLAAQPGVRHSLDNPSVYVQSNIVAFVNVLEGLRNAGITDFVYASSSSVYGNNKIVPFAVHHEVNEPISLYAATKKSNELMAYTYHSLFGMHTTGLRFFTVIGPYGRPDMALMLFAEAIVNDRPIKIFNFGKMKRDFTYVEDIVDGIMLALIKVNGNNVYNLGNSNPVELEYFIECMERELGKKAIREYVPVESGDMLQTFADIRHTTEQLGWEPKTPVEESIKRFAEWYKAYSA